MDVREKLEVIAHLGDHISYKEDIGICYDSALAKVIEDAYMTLKNGVTVQEWISVKDERKPKQLQECLCVCQFDDDAKGEWRFYNVLRWHDVPYQDNGIVNRPHFTDEGVHGMVVTHWMPLPEPPKGERLWI